MCFCLPRSAFSYSCQQASLKSAATTATTAEAASTEHPLSYTCTVTNTGGVISDTVVLGWLTSGNASDAPLRELFAFSRVTALAPGKTVHVNMTLSPQVLALVNEEGTSSVRDGVYKLRIGGDALGGGCERHSCPTIILTLHGKEQILFSMSEVEKRHARRLSGKTDDAVATGWPGGFLCTSKTLCQPVMTPRSVADMLTAGSDAHRADYIRIFLEHAAKLKSLQGGDGAWRASLLDKAGHPLGETTATANVLHALAWVISTGVLTAAEFLPVVERAWVAGLFLRAASLVARLLEARTPVHMKVDDGDALIVPAAALAPPLGWSNWNGFEMQFNASLLLNTAKELKKNGLAAKGYTLIQYGGASYPASLVNHGLPPHWNSTNVSNNKYVTVRNSTGYYQIDPGKFRGPGSSAECMDDKKFIACMIKTGSWPGHNATDQWNGQPELCGCKNGNAAVAALSAELHAMGFRFGSYAGSGGLCQVAACNIPSMNNSKFQGFVDQDFDLYIKEWKSDYIMVDSVGATAPFTNGKSDPRYYTWNADILKTWRKKIDTAELNRPIILHSCHNGCATTFNGPTLVAAPCNETDPRQRWMVSTNITQQYMSQHPTTGLLHDAGSGLCAGCALDMHYGGPACANTALRDPAGHGLGQQACIPGTDAVMGHGRRWNYSMESKMFMNVAESVLEVLPAPGNQVVMRGQSCIDVPLSTHFSGGQWANCVPCCGPYPAVDAGVQLPNCANNVSCASVCNGKRTQQWDLGPPDARGYTTVESLGRPGMCLASGTAVKTPLPDWCSTMNMWRTSTDTLAVWPRLMQQLESMVGLGTVSGPGHWGFADCLELGVPCSLTWEQSKSHLALWAVTSNPLFLGNDAREGSMQPRLVDILGNEDMLSVNQEYTSFAGDRMWSQAPGREVWAKPLKDGRVGVVVFNRNGSTPKCTNHAGTVRNGTRYAAEVITCPCDDDTNSPEYSGTQDITFDFGVLPSAWLLSQDGTTVVSGGGTVGCALRDIWRRDGKPGRELGNFVGSYTAKDLAPHASRFLMLSNCSRHSSHM